MCSGSNTIDYLVLVLKHQLLDLFVSLINRSVFMKATLRHFFRLLAPASILVYDFLIFTHIVVFSFSGLASIFQKEPKVHISSAHSLSESRKRAMKICLSVVA